MEIFDTKGLLRFPAKAIRARCIRDWMTECNIRKAVCFSCGNAVDALRNIGVDVLYIGDKGDLIPNKWFTEAEIRNIFPDYFDATSGHLPMGLMNRIAKEFWKYLGADLGKDIVEVPTGSGETLLCLKLAYPTVKFTPVYDLDEATKYSPYAPLNEIVDVLSIIEV